MTNKLVDVPTTKYLEKPRKEQEIAMPSRTRENFVIFKFNQSEKNGTSVTRTPVGHYRTCAVVGNSGILRDSGCGDDIDRNDFVIRVNGAPLKTFEQDVGEKTNMTIINRRALDQIDRLNSDPHLIISRNNSIMSYILGTHGNFTALNTMIRKLDLNITITYSVSPPRPHIKTFWNEKYNSNLSEMATTAGLNTYTLATSRKPVVDAACGTQARTVVVETDPHAKLVLTGTYTDVMTVIIVIRMAENISLTI
ncbi:hypothetical protein Bbelb_322680 [Branchiostoma belcheri]|nr:hypothetical protein Bbelb_322680 [Branchiostoma belcheri]